MKRISPLRNGERLLCLGDSTTQNGAWPYFLQELLLGHAGKSVEVINAGISGGSAGDALVRLDYDVIDRKPNRVLLQLGMNDVCRELYHIKTPDNELKRKQLDALDSFRGKMREIIRRLTERGIEVILMTTLPYDQYHPELPGNLVACNSMGLSDLNGITRELADEFDLGFIDHFTPTTELYQQHPELWITTDRVHPKRFGYLPSAVRVLEALGVRRKSGLIDFSTSHLHCRLARASAVEFTASGVRFVCHPGNLPFHRDEDYRIISQAVDLDTLINTENWRLTGLPEARYRLRAGGVDCGCLYATELAAGINSTLLPTPAAAVAANLASLVKELCLADAPRRRIIQIELLVRQRGVDPADETAMRSALAAFQQDVADKPYAPYYRQVIEEYWQLRPFRAQYEERRKALFAAFSAARVLPPYVVELTKE